MIWCITWCSLAAVSPDMFSVHIVRSPSRSSSSPSSVLYAPILSPEITGPVRSVRSVSVSRSFWSALSLMCCWLVLVMGGQCCAVGDLFGADLTFVWCRHLRCLCMMSHSSAARVCSSNSSVVYICCGTPGHKDCAGWLLYRWVLCLMIVSVNVKSSRIQKRLLLSSWHYALSDTPGSMTLCLAVFLCLACSRFMWTFMSFQIFLLSAFILYSFSLV